MVYDVPTVLWLWQAVQTNCKAAKTAIFNKWMEASKDWMRNLGLRLCFQAVSIKSEIIETCPMGGPGLQIPIHTFACNQNLSILRVYFATSVSQIIMSLKIAHLCSACPSIIVVLPLRHYAWCTYGSHVVALVSTYRKDVRFR